MRVPEAEKFNKDLLSGVSVTPWDLHTPKQLEVIVQRHDADGQPLAERLADKLYKSRKVYLPASGFEEYGLTRGCPKCNHFLKFGTWGSAPHSQACRSRIEQELTNTPSGIARLKAASERLDLSTSDHGQQHREDVQQAASQGELSGNDDVVRQQAETSLPSFIEMPSSSNSSPAYRESGEVPPPTDEAGSAEIRGEHDGDHSVGDADVGMARHGH